jgi:hypothetical protein
VVEGEGEGHANNARQSQLRRLEGSRLARKATGRRELSGAATLGYDLGLSLRFEWQTHQSHHAPL